jgi:uncharacterized membrane protein
MTYLMLALLLGVVAGLRAMTPLAAVSWGAHLGLIAPSGWLAVLGYAWTPWILTALALAELVTDQLPATPSRKVPMQFGTRIVSGAVCGAAVGGAEGLWLGAALGAVGAIVGTLGGAAVRERLAKAFGRDLPAALLEDLVAVGGAALLVATA